jgi:hypothetical protein
MKKSTSENVIVDGSIWLNSANQSLGTLNLYNVDSPIIAPGYAPPGCYDSSSPANLITTSSPACGTSPCASAASAGSTYVSNAGKISDPYGDSDCPDAKPASETNIGFASCPPSTLPVSATGHESGEQLFTVRSNRVLPRSRKQEMALGGCQYSIA